MKKVIIIILFFIPFLWVHAQFDIFFNKSYRPDDAIILSPAIEVVDGAYLTVGVYRPDSTFNDYRTIYVRMVDILGNNVWLKHLDEGFDITTVTTGGQLTKTHDNNFAVTYTTKSEGTPEYLDINVIKFDQWGDVLWHQVHESGVNVTAVARQIIVTNDGGFMIAGGRQFLGESRTGYLLKLNEEGNKQWETDLLSSLDAISLSVQQTQDGGYIVGGWDYFEVTDYDMYIVKTDSNGEVEWEQHYGTEFTDCGCRILPFQNGGYLMTGCLGADNLFEHYGYIAALDHNGEIIWDNTTDFEMLAFQSFPIINEEGHLMMLAARRNNFGNTDVRVIQLDLTNQGEILWTKDLTLDPETDCYLKDIEATPDGGYVLAGYQFTAPQSSWVLKIDAQGNTCEPADCDTIIVQDVVAVTPQIPSNPYHIYLSPNPASEVVTVAYQLPIDFPFGTLRLYDLQGSLVMKQRLDTWLHKATVSVLDLAAGLYVYEVDFMGRGVGSGKLVVE